jgi:HAMP domain-containing protein
MSIFTKIQDHETELQDLYHEVENMNVSRETKEEIQNHINDALKALQNALNVDCDE